MEVSGVQRETSGSGAPNNGDSPEAMQHILDCPACQAIDAADGKIDGQVFNLDHWMLPSQTDRFVRLKKTQDNVADRVTSFAGSLKFVYLHAMWFGIWIVLNIGLIHLGIKKFDKYPFGLLTMIVSLEAIFLATFVMVSQNRQAKRSDLRAQIDFESNLRSLIIITHLAAKDGVDLQHVDKIVALAIHQSHVLGDENGTESSEPAQNG
ncbi:unannotated protein [freshwater metagenome]|uniref:Unannotated protein n=1 Tax=freshwater metagenome TaxID=449393 RepID=A0A6J6MN94_9ZZZZ